MPYEATPSQLDRIAEVNARSKRQARGSLGRWLALVAVVAALLVLAYRWQQDRSDESLPVRAPQPVAAPPLADVQPTAASAPALAPALPDVVAAEAVPQGAAASAAAAPTASSAPAVDRARQARAKQEAEARAKALQQELALARTLAEEQDRERREAERARELADDAKRRAAEAAPSRAAPAPEPRRNVHDLCSASSNIVSELFCHSRECRKPENRADATCVRLREIEEAQRLGGRQ
jgi:hypothetical protein